VVGDKIHATGDDHHGHNEQGILGNTPETFELKSFGQPEQHLPTSPYSGSPTCQPYSDGRMFIRGSDGIFCYDLRKDGASAARPSSRPASRTAHARHSSSIPRLRVTIGPGTAVVGGYDIRGRQRARNAAGCNGIAIVRQRADD
jgi:hypothetical protein